MDEVLKERWQAGIYRRFLDLLPAADPDEVLVYFTDETGEDSFIVEWLTGPDYWSYPSHAAESILAGTYTAPYNARSMLVAVTDPTALDR